MVKKILIISVIAILIGGGYYAFSLYSYEKKKDITGKSSSDADATSKTVVIETPEGGVTVENPAREAAPESPSTLMVEDQDFLIEYYAPDQSFSIALMNPDIWKARMAAEARLLEKLHISQEEACKLVVNLSVPLDVNAEASGKNYGLSFCLGASPLPEQTPDSLR